VELVKKLIQAGGDINTKDGRGDTPLHSASRYGHVEVITTLLAAGADKTIKNKHGKTPHDVAWRHQDCRNALEYWYPLHAASKNGHVEEVERLIKAGADVNEQDGKGATPLHYASENGHVEVITVLLAANADKTIKTTWLIGSTPHDVAKNQATRNALE